VWGWALLRRTPHRGRRKRCCRACCTCVHTPHPCPASGHGPWKPPCGSAYTNSSSAYIKLGCMSAGRGLSCMTRGCASWKVQPSTIWYECCECTSWRGPTCIKPDCWCPCILLMAAASSSSSSAENPQTSSGSCDAGHSSWSAGFALLLPPRQPHPDVQNLRLSTHAVMLAQMRITPNTI